MNLFSAYHDLVVEGVGIGLAEEVAGSGLAVESGGGGSIVIVVQW